MSLVRPQYVCFAATRESGITSLDRVAERPRPIGLLTVSKSRHQTRFVGIVHGRTMEECGFTQETIVGNGGDERLTVSRLPDGLTYPGFAGSRSGNPATASD